MSEPSNSAFRALMKRAHELGAFELFWSVKLESIDPDGLGFWTCRALLDPQTPHIAVGRTGEEALRELVMFLEKTRG